MSEANEALQNMHPDVIGGAGESRAGNILLPRLFNKGDFYFGVADNGIQNEGSNPNSDWSSWLTPDQRDRMAANAANKNWGQGVVEDLPACASQPDTYDIGRAPSHWTRYLEDYEIAKQLDQETLHTSIEWSRIQPEQHVPYDKDALSIITKCGEPVAPMVWNQLSI